MPANQVSLIGHCPSRLSAVGQPHHIGMLGEPMFACTGGDQLSAGNADMFSTSPVMYCLLPTEPLISLLADHGSQEHHRPHSCIVTQTTLGMPCPGKACLPGKLHAFIPVCATRGVLQALQSQPPVWTRRLSVPPGHPGDIARSAPTTWWELVPQEATAGQAAKCATHVSALHGVVLVPASVSSATC